MRKQLSVRRYPERVATSTTRSLTARQSEAWFGLLHAHADLVKQVDTELLAAHRLPLSAHEILHRLSGAPDGHLSVTDLAGRVLLSSSRVSRLVDELERQGLVERRSCPGDARVSHVTVTEAGASRLEQADETFHEAIRRHFVDRLTQAEVEALAAVWSKLNRGPSSC
jgi:DNA-binding MarR family transcriptional regulator